MYSLVAENTRLYINPFDRNKGKEDTDISTVQSIDCD